MKRLVILCFTIFLTVSKFLFSQNVTVNPGAGSYATLKAAFDAVNAGTHTGAVTIDIINNTTETATAVINNSGTGAASYSSIYIKPFGGAKTISGNINGAVIKFNYADNITIDGRVAGEGRFLTLKNTNSINANTAVLWLSSNGFGDVPGSSKNVIRNCEISCGTNSSSSTTENFGIFQGGNTISSSAFGGAHNDSNSYIENKITKCRNGIFLYAYSTNYDYNNLIQKNIVGASSFGSDIIGRAGIFTLYQNYCSIIENEVQYIGGPRSIVSASSDRTGIGIELISWNSSNTGSNRGHNYTVMNNKIHDIVDENLGSCAAIIIAAVGIEGFPTNNIVANNEIYNVRCNGTSGKQLVGIGIAGGGSGGDKIVYNSIYLAGDVDPPTTASSTDTTGGAIIKKYLNPADSSLLIENNSIYIDLRQNNDTARTKTKYCIITPTGYNWGSGGLYNNDYYFPPGNTDMMTGGAGITTSIIPYSTLANWKTAYSPQQENGSIQLNPVYSLNPSNYLMPNSASPLFNNAKPVSSVTADILGITRNMITPTIGAYEKDTALLNKIILNLFGNIQGFYNNVTNTEVADTIKVILKSNIFPYNSIDSSKAILSSSGSANINFNAAASGTYYIVFMHRNSIQTWSKSGGQTLSIGTVNSYSFSDLISKAYGDNMILKGAKYCFYSGDVNQDGVVDAPDLNLADNDAFNFVTGYVNTDVNGNNVVDASDLTIIDNNAYNFVSRITPP